MAKNDYNTTDEGESPQEAWPARENSSLGFIEAVHEFKVQKFICT